MTPFSFDKNKTDVVKGIAILMMVWLHTFGVASRMDMYTSIMHLKGGESIECLFAKACNPVGLFMVLSGYGLYLWFDRMSMSATTKTKILGQSLRQTTRRVIRMYIPWWITLAVGMPLSYMAGMIDIPFSWSELLYHLVAWHVEWNGVGWYILPFVLISYLLPLIFPSFKKHSMLWLAFGFLSYFGINKVYGMYWEFLCSYHGLKILCQLFEFLFPMLLGAYVAKNRDWVINLHVSDKFYSIVCTLCVPLMFGLCIYLKGMPMYPIYCAILVLLIVNAHFSGIASKVLMILGNHSLNIWFIHLYLIPFAYKLQYSVLVYMAIVICSLVLSAMVNFISKQLKL